MKRRYRITVGDGRSTEALVAAGDYGYAHSCLISENFPARHGRGRRQRELWLLEFEGDVTADDVIREATARGLARPTYEDALYFGIEHPEVQRERPVVFRHEPWFGYFGRWEVVYLWCNAGRRELGLEGFDATWDRSYRFAFVAPPSGPTSGSGPR